MVWVINIEQDQAGSILVICKYAGIQMFPILKLPEIQPPNECIPKGPLVHWLKARAWKLSVINSPVIACIVAIPTVAGWVLQGVPNPFIQMIYIAKKPNNFQATQSWTSFSHLSELKFISLLWEWSISTDFTTSWAVGYSREYSCLFLNLLW